MKWNEILKVWVRRWADFGHRVIVHDGCLWRIGHKPWGLFSEPGKANSYFYLYFAAAGSMRFRGIKWMYRCILKEAQYSKERDLRLSGVKRTFWRIAVDPKKAHPLTAGLKSGLCQDYGYTTHQIGLRASSRLTNTCVNMFQSDKV